MCGIVRARGGKREENELSAPAFSQAELSVGPKGGRHPDKVECGRPSLSRIHLLLAPTHLFDISPVTDTSPGVFLNVIAP